jgi:hypothetical protein
VALILVVEEQADRVGRVELLGPHLFVRDKTDIGIGVAEQRDQQCRHRAGQPAAVLLLELDRVGEPADQIAQGADRKLHQNVAPGGRVFVTEDAVAFLPHLDRKAHEIALDAVDERALAVDREQDVAGVEVGEPHVPGAGGQSDAAAEVEVEADAARALLGRHRRRRRIGGFRRPTLRRRHRGWTRARRRAVSVQAQGFLGPEPPVRVRERRDGGLSRRSVQLWHASQPPRCPTPRFIDRSARAPALDRRRSDRSPGSRR